MKPSTAVADRGALVRPAVSAGAILRGKADLLAMTTAIHRLPAPRMDLLVADLRLASVLPAVVGSGLPAGSVAVAEVVPVV